MQVQTLTIQDGIESLSVSGVVSVDFKAISWRGNDLLVQMKNGNVLLFRGAHATRIAGKNPLLVFDDIGISLNHFSGPSPGALAAQNSSTSIGEALRVKARKKPARQSQAEKVALDAENEIWVSQAYEQVEKESSASANRTSIALDSSDLSTAMPMAETLSLSGSEQIESPPTSGLMTAASGNWVLYALGAGLAAVGLSGKKNNPIDASPIANNNATVATNIAPTPVGTVAVQSGKVGSVFASLSLSPNFADVDAGNQFTYAVTAGTLPVGLTLNRTTGTISGTPTAASTASVTVTATDSGGLTTSQTVRFNFSASPNKAPSGADKTLVVVEDLAYTFEASDFGFVDALGENNALKSITITAPPAAGTLKLNGVDVVSNQVISVAALPGLQFKPASHANGNAYSTVKFKLTDDGGTAESGADTSGEKTLSFNVSSVNDAPTTVGAVLKQTGQVGSVLTPLNLSASFADVDADNQFTYSVTAGTLPVGLTLNRTTGIISGTPTAAIEGAVTIRATDSGGLTADQSVTFSVLPVTIQPPQAMDTAVPNWIAAPAYAINTPGLSITDPRMGIASLISNDGLDTTMGLITPQIQASWLPMTANDAQRPTASSSSAALSLSYAFQNTGALYLNDSGVEKTVQAGMSYTNPEQAFVRAVFDNFASFANVVFTENAGINSQQYANAGGADMRLFKGTATDFGVSLNTLGFAYQPGQYDSKTLDNSGNFFLVTDALAYPTANAFGFAYGLEKQTVSHELGHAMGLDHPFGNTVIGITGWYGETDTMLRAANRLGTVSGGSYDTPLTDAPQETLMAYYKPFESVRGISNALLPAQSEVFTPWKAGLYDIAALQHLYGANMNYNTTDTTYSYDSSTPVFDTLWDARGNDTLTQVGNQAAVIDLRGGDHMSRMGLFSGAKYVFSETVLETNLKGANSGRADITGMKAIYTGSDGVTHQVGYLSRSNSEWTYLTDPTMPTGLDVELIVTFDFYNSADAKVSSDQTIKVANLPRICVADPSMHFNIGIAHGVVIENAVGGGGNDVIWGNAAANQITTGAGSDRVKYDSGANINGDTLTDFANVDLLDLSALNLTAIQQAQINWDTTSSRLTYFDAAQSANSWALTILGTFSKSQLVLA